MEMSATASSGSSGASFTWLESSDGVAVGFLKAADALGGRGTAAGDADGAEVDGRVADDDRDDADVAEEPLKL